MIAFVIVGVVALVIGLELLDAASARRRQREHDRRTDRRAAPEAHRPKVRPVGRPAWAWVWACGCTALDARNVGAAETQYAACTAAARHVRAEREGTSS